MMHVEYSPLYNSYHVTGDDLDQQDAIIISADYFGRKRARQIALELFDLCNGEERTTPFEARLFQKARTR